MTSISVSVLSKRVHNGLTRRAVGRQNQMDVYLAIVKRSGNENGTPASQTFVCKNQERRVSFEYPTRKGSRDIGDGYMRVPDSGDWIRRTGEGPARARRRGVRGVAHERWKVLQSVPFAVLMPAFFRHPETAAKVQFQGRIWRLEFGHELIRGERECWKGI